MDNLVVANDINTAEHQPTNPIRISNASDTSKAAADYAQQLRTEFYALLYKPMAQADIKVAGRFCSLIDELFFMADQTARNVKAGR